MGGRSVGRVVEFGSGFGDLEPGGSEGAEDEVGVRGGVEVFHRVSSLVAGQDEGLFVDQVVAYHEVPIVGCIHPSMQSPIRHRPRRHQLLFHIIRPRPHPHPGALRVLRILQEAPFLRESGSLAVRGAVK